MVNIEIIAKGGSLVKPKILFYLFSIFCLILAGVSITTGENPRTGPSVDFDHGRLKVSENKRFLVHEDGTPFFYLGDTAWELFHRLNREEAEKYLEIRRKQGFTVIQAVVLAELDGLNTPNAYGDRPLNDNNPTKPNEDYAFIYLPYGQKVSVVLGKISGEKVKAWWFDPRAGRAEAAGTFDNRGTQQFDPPGEPKRGNDWVLVLDDAGKDHLPPGRKR